MKDFFPVLPAVNLGHVVGPHDPDESDAGKARRQRPDGVGRGLGAQGVLDGGDDEAWVARLPLGARHAGLERRHAVAALQGVLGADHPPDLVERQSLVGEQRNIAVAGVGRVERAAEQADAHAGTRQVPAERAAKRAPVHVGRLAPAPSHNQ